MITIDDQVVGVLSFLYGATGNTEDDVAFTTRTQVLKGMFPGNRERGVICLELMDHDGLVKVFRARGRYKPVGIVLLLEKGYLALMEHLKNG